MGRSDVSDGGRARAPKTLKETGASIAERGTKMVKDRKRGDACYAVARRVIAAAGDCVCTCHTKKTPLLMVARNTQNTKRRKKKNVRGRHDVAGAGKGKAKGHATTPRARLTAAEAVSPADVSASASNALKERLHAPSAFTLYGWLSVEVHSGTLCDESGMSPKHFLDCSGAASWIECVRHCAMMQVKK